VPSVTIAPMPKYKGLLQKNDLDHYDRLPSWFFPSNVRYHRGRCLSSEQLETDMSNDVIAKIIDVEIIKNNLSIICT
jgi:hypothetical protein